MSTTFDSSPASSAPSSEFIPLSEPCLRGNESKYVQQCLDTGWVSSSGAFVDRFESAVASYSGANHAVATVNGTAALHTGLLAVGVRPGDEVLVSTLTFIASANSIHYAGAHPVLFDVERKYWQIDVNLVAEFLQERCQSIEGVLYNRATGRRIAAMMPVHVLGHPVQIDRLLELARKYNLPLVEDAAESLGAEYNDRRIGGFGDVTCFSFNGNKTITAGAGGMLVTNEAEIAERAKYLTTQAKDDPVEYIHHEVGYNYRMPNVLAAIGLAQLEQIDEIVSRKREIAATYQRELDTDGVDWHIESPHAFSTYWLSTALVDSTRTRIDTTSLRLALQERGVQTRRLWQPMHASRPYADCQSVLTGVADRIATQALSFPSSTSLTSEQQSRVIATLKSILSSV